MQYFTIFIMNYNAINGYKGPFLASKATATRVFGDRERKWNFKI